MRNGKLQQLQSLPQSSVPAHLQLLGSYQSQKVLPTMPLQADAAPSGIPLNVKLQGDSSRLGGTVGNGSNATLQHHVNKVNTKIIYEDPIERKKREREQRILQERAELANMRDPFSNLGQANSARSIQRSVSEAQFAAPPASSLALQNAGMFAVNGGAGQTSLMQNQLIMNRIGAPLKIETSTPVNTYIPMPITPGPTAQQHYLRAPIHNLHDSGEFDLQKEQTERGSRRKKGDIAGKIGQGQHPSATSSFQDNSAMGNGGLQLGGAGLGNNGSFGQIQQHRYSQLQALQPPLTERAPQLNVYQPLESDFAHVGGAARHLKPLRQHQVSQIPIAKLPEHHGNQEHFQLQKVTNLESGEQMNERFKKQSIQKQILEEQIAEARAKKALQRQQERDAEYREEQRLRQDMAQAARQQHNASGEDRISPQTQAPPAMIERRPSPETTAFDMGGNDDSGPRVLTQKEKNLRHAKAGRAAAALNNNSLSKELSIQNHDTPERHGPPIIQISKFSDGSRSPPPMIEYNRDHIEQEEHRYRMAQAQKDMVIANKASQKLAIQKIESQFKQELSKFRDELTVHREDYNKVLDQLKNDAKHTSELRKQAEKASKELNERQTANKNTLQVLSSRGANSARRILELKQLDDQRMAEIIQRHRSQENLPQLPRNVNQFQAIHDRVQMANQNVGETNAGNIQAFTKDGIPINSGETSESLVAETQFIANDDTCNENLRDPSQANSAQALYENNGRIQSQESTALPSSQPMPPQAPSQHIPFLNMPILSQPEQMQHPQAYTSAALLEQRNLDTMTVSLDGHTLYKLKEIDNLNKQAQESLNQMRGRPVPSYSLPSQIGVPRLPNEQKIEAEWRQAMKEPLPLYWNPDGTRTTTAQRSRSISPRPTTSISESKPFANLTPPSPRSTISRNLVQNDGSPGQSQQPLLTLVNQTATWQEENSVDPLTSSKRNKSKSENKDDSRELEQRRSTENSQRGIHTAYLDKMSSFKKSQSPVSARKVYQQTQVELIVARIEDLLNRNKSSGSGADDLDSILASNSSMLKGLDDVEKRKLLESLKKFGSKIDEKKGKSNHAKNFSSKTPSPIGLSEAQTILDMRKHAKTVKKQAEDSKDTSYEDSKNPPVSGSNNSFGIRLEKVRNNNLNLPSQDNIDNIKTHSNEEGAFANQIENNALNRSEDDQGVYGLGVGGADKSSLRHTEMTRSAGVNHRLQEDKSMEIAEEISIDKSIISEPKDTVFLTQNVNEDFEDD